MLLTTSILRNMVRAQGVTTGIRRSLSINASTASKCYELRTYAILPSAFLDFVKLTNEHMHLRLAHSKLVGYWVADLGALNQAVHIWEYDSWMHRKEVRANLAADQNWLDVYLSKMTKMLSWQDNITINLMPWCCMESKPCKEGGVYELKEMVMKPFGQAEWGRFMKQAVLTQAEAHTKYNYGKLMGAWNGDFGKMSSFYQLWNFESLDHRIEQKAEIENLPQVKEAGETLKKFVTEHVTSKALLAMPFSPLK